ncbi:bifunctional hydroxymethylpyrimidine kinase/phosphomethylpyrimidine kinase [Motiliproteus sp. SC1-56]|uniref:bifunctional hydroxymethylpyrimidine kinase/phosphomethylpyrimidine kinase n=1 Tax=Motiliproteus sp. SC1-56 TaxID=2799565 RepID=UPI001A8D3266|nr:bifunctional hydroxymethylpyrimidine kinase/phosphomethylpyrimidine kinase [Motiliproteus sp. SC1-56]
MGYREGRCVLAVGGSDSGAGAGVQADLKTCAALGVYAATAVTAVTAQNSRGVRAVAAVDPVMVREQVEAVLEDYPVGVVKLGMLCTGSVVSAVADVLVRYPRLPVVIDPVLASTGGHVLLDAEGVELLCRRLLPRAALLTPNIPEAGALIGRSEAAVVADRIGALQALIALGPEAVLLKGGHLPGVECEDLLLEGGGVTAYRQSRLAVRNTHGTGCTLAAAVAAGLAQGLDLKGAVAQAKHYVREAIKRADEQRLVSERGPLAHFFKLSKD